MTVMFERLVALIEKRTLSAFPQLKQAENLQAAITHWLHDNTAPFSFRTEELIDLWITTQSSFLSEVKTDLNQIINSEYPLHNPGEDFRFIDLFAGIGGFKLALESNGGKCVFSSEWDKGAQKTYFKNYAKIPFGDINHFTGEGISEKELDRLIPEHEILAGGFPCQPFSHAGVSARTALGLAHGFDCDTQGNLFHSIAKIAYVKQPQVVFMENVRNLVNHNNGETFEVIRNTMENLSQGVAGKHNYVFFHDIVDSQTVVAQRRKRCFMVCIREDIWRNKGQRTFEFPEFNGEPIALGTITALTTPEEAAEYTISDALWQGHQNRTARNLERNTGFTAHAADLNRPSNTIVARYGKDGKECLVPQEGLNPRKLTKNECRQLFGYPIEFRPPSAKTPAYKQFGNSVVVPVVQQIAKSIVKYLRK